jgi:hypothetical protein
MGRKTREIYLGRIIKVHPQSVKTKGIKEGLLNCCEKTIDTLQLL